MPRHCDSCLKVSSVGEAFVRIPSKIAAELGICIVSGRLKSGTVLAGEVEASDERKVSRAAYREAMRILAAKGLVQSRPRTGTRVTDGRLWHLLDPDVLSWIFTHEPPRELLNGLFELRKVMEPEAAALAAERRNPEQLKGMKAALKIMAQETLHTPEGQQADGNFHNLLFAATKNPFFMSLSDGVTSAVAWSTLFKKRTDRLRRDAIPDHVQVYERIAASDPAGARIAMHRLIELAYSDTTQ